MANTFKPKIKNSNNQSSVAFKILKLPKNGWVLKVTTFFLGGKVI